MARPEFIPSNDDRNTGVSLSDYPGPVVMLDSAGTFTPLNGGGERLEEALQKPFGAATASMLKELAVQAAETECAVVERISLPESDDREAEWFEATLLPQDGGNTLILCRDVTMDVNVKSALVESRQRYKDIVEVACDFAWESDMDGRLTFLSSGKPLGYSTEFLLGKNPSSLLAQPSVSNILPFNASDTVLNEEIWLTHADGHAACLMVSSRPILDGLGRRTGNRGICRDITVQRLRDDILSRSRMRDRVVSYIVDTFRSKERPEELLNTAAISIGRALEARGCEIFTRSSGGDLSSSSSFGIAASGEPWIQEVLDQIEDEGKFEGQRANLTVLAATTTHNQRDNGALILIRDAEGAVWSEDDRVLVSSLREPLGIALSQIGEQKKLEQLSRIDELTGLLNRRAFHDDLRSRITRSERRGRSGALIYVDLDNFKPVNDTFGHKKGDEVLKILASILQESIREYDLAARLGGDEFAIWLDDTTEEIAMTRGENIVTTCRKLSAFSATDDKPLSVSAGVAVFDPETVETFDGLVARADMAMYEAKRKGKGQAAMAPHAEPATD